MRYPLHRCPLLTSTTKAVDGFLARIQHLPGGYAWWYGLSEKGRSGRIATRRLLTCTMLCVLMPVALQRAMLLACFEPSGRVALQAKPLHKWLCTNMYNNDEIVMMKAWLKLVHGALV